MLLTSIRDMGNATHRLDEEIVTMFAKTLLLQFEEEDVNCGPMLTLGAPVLLIL
jgi:hypothetical protein